ncbi:MAG: c-type cytochrome [Chitinophaga rupis]
MISRDKIFLGLTIISAIAYPSCRHSSPPNKEAPVLPPDSAITKMHVEEGFAVQLVASEPLIAAPVALSFDEKGRIWVVEMMDYMPDTAGKGEELPTGKVVILSDRNGDGIMDDSQVFLDSLVLPRAICLIEDGILVAEPPRLWYYQIKDDKPVNKTLVDSAYTEGGNVEHQPNGLYRAMDNWIYNAKSARRYKKSGNRWLIETTHFRGQWGLSQDDYGRLYYNNNSENLLGDYFPPGLGAENPHQKQVAGFNEKIVADNRVYPVRPTRGVNRGYMPGVLDDSGRLVEFTAACGPLIYTGGSFDSAHEGNAFVAEPAANLIKRDLLISEGYRTSGKQAYEKKEFLASEDERFRPVNLHIGPDGALYIADMYRGIIQHVTYLTPYLKKEIADRALTKPLNGGRIYKVVPIHTHLQPLIFNNNPAGWVNLLQDHNSWVRNKAQQLLVDKKDKAIVPALRQYLHNPHQPIPLIHALWTLEGLNSLLLTDVLPLLKLDQQENQPLRLQALTILPEIINKNNYRSILPLLNSIKDSLAAPYLAFIANSIRPFDPTAAHNILIGLLQKYPDHPYVTDAIISNLYDREESFYKEAITINPDTTVLFNKRLKKLITDITKAKNTSNLKELTATYPRGSSIFLSFCQTCHGKDGNGITSLAPPLNGSNWVQGDKNKLIPIVLYGLTGPVKVAGKLYRSPEINGDMPGIGANTSFTDEDIAQTLSFIRNAWNNKGQPINAADIASIRKKLKDRQKPLTTEELEQFK